MVNALLLAYLAGPALLGLAVAWYLFTRPADRIQLATATLFLCSLFYGAVAYQLASRGGQFFLPSVALGVYALVLYAAMGALAIYAKRWAWRLAVASFGLQILVGLALAPKFISEGHTASAALLAFLTAGAIGLWATLHKGTKNAVSAQAAEV